MELRRNPVTLQWVIQEENEAAWPDGPCPLCPGQEHQSPQTLYQYSNGSPDWQVRVTPHLRPLYRIEGSVQRRGDGIYDTMRNVGAHEIVVESPDHSRPLSQQSDENFAQVLRAYITRITDLKKDPRFRYVSVFRNQGRPAGQELDHPHSQITALPFVPRQLAYELRTLKRYFDLKERCLICDILRQEIEQQIRTVEWDDCFMAFCPFASRVPFETWVLPVRHHNVFEEHLADWAGQLHFARFLKGVLQRVEASTPAYYLVLHTSPNVGAKFEKPGHWNSLAEDFHWHFEVLPVVSGRSKSYGVREVYYNSVSPEAAAQRLRSASILSEAIR
jgi:UDPglucose--hexose-1-phosphate uridylyltransferase